MAGHSKWANIKHQKAKQDAKRGKIFTKFIREITTAAKLGGGDIDSNPRLRAAVDKAYTNNMTKDTITRAIKRGAGGEDDSNLMETRYEGYGPNGVAFLVETLTDNKNRTLTEVRNAVAKTGGQFVDLNSVLWQFENKGVIEIKIQNISNKKQEDIELLIIDSGALDFIIESEGDTRFIIDEVVSRYFFERENKKVLSQGGQPAVGRVSILGVTRAAMYSDSWLSAASFQGTTSVLTAASIKGQVDNLIGLKENVIIGRLIPVNQELLDKYYNKSL